ncbi:hypothetical protein EDB92DRAFT_1818383 [Lactarius akahatsu]|uniref:Uncharacterized protein n=1 Tax=Lactarius akahatsu TaxID=416441 RepID=A0AAD4QB79_9AGAM|nr:hypothetical protein EDB92DRAFT_1818383 [Lactarius akahatsu]
MHHATGPAAPCTVDADMQRELSSVMGSPSSSSDGSEAHEESTPPYDRHGAIHNEVAPMHEARQHWRCLVVPSRRMMHDVAGRGSSVQSCCVCIARRIQSTNGTQQVVPTSRYYELKASDGWVVFAVAGLLVLTLCLVLEFGTPNRCKTTKAGYSVRHYGQGYGRNLKLVDRGVGRRRALSPKILGAPRIPNRQSEYRQHLE